MINQLDIYVNFELAAYIFLQQDQLVWEYSEAWKRTGFAVSPHLPLNEAIPNINVSRFLRNLLPEGQALEELIKCYNLSKTNTFALLRALGLDIPGSMVAVAHEQTMPTEGEFRPIHHDELARRLDNQKQLSLIIWDGKPRLSVAGVQDKINVVVDDNQDMGFGEGALCSTHLLKFEKQTLSHLVLNEYVSMQLAAACGLDVANTTLMHFGEHSALLVERFDRKRVSKCEVRRYHVIDGCQALNLPPEYKYERNYGSGRDVAHIREGASVLKLFKFAEQCTNPAVTKKKMLDWILFNILIYNADAHGKNISFFVSKNGMSLTPFYDLVNIKMYNEFEQDMAMAIGDEFDSDSIHAYQLADFADSCSLSRRFVAKQFQGIISKCFKALNDQFGDIARNSQERRYLDQYKETVHQRGVCLLRELADIGSIEL